MYDFIIAALPWIAMGIAVAIVLANENNKKKVKFHSNERPDNITDEETANINGEKNYITYGMLFGISFGIAIGASFSDKFGSIALTYGICFGMLIGTLVGILIKKK